MNVSIIIPTLNEADNLRRLLPHLMENTHAGDEIIVCDAQSPDGSAQVAQSLGAIVLSCNRGRALQMNAGAISAKNNILYFVHADAFPPKNFKKDIATALDGGMDLGCYRFRFDSSSKLLKINSYFTRFDKMMCRGGDQTLFVRKDVFDQLNGFDEDHVIMEDYDFLLRARKKHHFCIMDGDVLVSSRKYMDNSYLRVNLSNFLVFKLYQMGMKPQRLDGLYKKLIKHPKA